MGALRPLLLLALVAACDDDKGGVSCRTDEDCAVGTCIDERCVTPRDQGMGPQVDGGEDAPDADCATSCEGACCALGERCAPFGCAPSLGECSSNDNCAGDSYCAADGFCTPYGIPRERTNDPSCERPIDIGNFEPQTQCAWTGEGDPLPDWSAVYSAPLVMDFNLDGDDTVIAPSLVFASHPATTGSGVLRIVDGRTCELQQTLDAPEDRLIYAANPAIGDLDGDGSTPEIVAPAVVSAESPGGLVAFEAVDGRFVRRWYSRRCDEPGEPRHIPNSWTNNNGPSMHDLDDDGIPELLFGRFVYSADGCLLNGGESYENYLGLGLFSIAMDMDADGSVELAHYDGVYDWIGGNWVRDPSWNPSAPEAERMGHVAVADFGEFDDDSEGLELVVASAISPDANSLTTGSVRVMTRTGRIIFGPFPLPGEPGGRGGPPTIGDFDGDGRPEFAVAGAANYTVFDLDCDTDEETAPGCMRAPGLPRGVLWSRPSQDQSSNVTGSSVFDFDADGVAEVVYADECYLRIYRGTDGEVLYSQTASSGTGYELPVIADVDGDFNSEIVVALTRGPACPASDPIFDGESLYEQSAGIVVLRDVMDRWAASRPVWNQHAYSVTNVSDTGQVPRTSEWTANARAGLNNYRTNAQGSLESTGAADLTVSLTDDICRPGELAELSANVCNRGTNPVADGARVVFYEGDPDAAEPVIACESTLPRLLDVGACTTVSCEFAIDSDDPPELTVVVDPDGEVFECRSENNRGVVPSVLCGLI